jgi:hypothetical protein
MILPQFNNSTNPRPPPRERWRKAGRKILENRKGATLSGDPFYHTHELVTSARDPTLWRGACRSSSEPTPPCR